ncbi:DUF695 domain-containing protein [Paenibacillus sp. y28]|uniref:DUF695 domain-containing protein n=1 Tax=Paenibacillus sp. y28 TaxID=3129110 RepID=UPI00301B3F86
MQRKWVYFHRQNEREDVRILLDISLRNQISRQRYPQLISVSINTYHVAENEQQSQVIMKQLMDIQDRVEQELAASEEGVFFGRVDSPSRLELFSYVQDGPGILPGVRSIVEEYGHLRTICNERNDAEWSLYQELLPSEQELMLATNEQRLRHLQVSGYKTGDEQTVHHWLHFGDKSKLDERKHRLVEAGYRVENTGYDPDKPTHKHTLHISKPIMLTVDGIHSAVLELERHAAEGGGDYGGWGIVPQPRWTARLRSTFPWIKRVLLLLLFITICVVLGALWLGSPIRG